MTRGLSSGRRERRRFTKAACAGAMAALPGIERQKQARRFEVIHGMRERLGRDFVINEAIECFGVSKAGFYKWRELHGCNGESETREGETE